MHLIKEPGETLLLTLDSVIEARSAIYAAGPLETGKGYFTALTVCGAVPANLRMENQQRLTAFVKHLRKTRRTLVIDPGILRCPGWAGEDYGNFFLEVIARYASEAWFLAGWHFSFGATKEFVYCQQLGIPCFDEFGGAISRQLGACLLHESAECLRNMGHDDSRLIRRLAALETST